MASPRVVIVDDGYDRYDIERDMLAPLGAEVVLLPCRGDAAAVAAVVVDADAVMVRESPIDAGAIRGMQRCKVIVRYGVGVDNIDRAAARECRIAVANVPDYGASEDVATHAVALLLAVARRIVTRDRDVRRGSWNVSRAEPMHRLAGATLGMIGCGRIGRSFAAKMRGMGVARVLVHDPQLGSWPEGIAAAEIDEICRAADFVSLHAPLTAQTRHVIDARRLALMKPTAILINTARGGLVDEAALARALRERRIFGAGLDVLEREPPPADDPLLGLDGVVLSDHTGWYSEQAVESLQSQAAAEVARVLRGEPPLNWVNPW